MDKGGNGGGTALRAVRHLGTAGAATVVVVGAALALFGPGDLDPASAREVVAAASLDVLDDLVEHGPDGTSWSPAQDNMDLSFGDGVRTDQTGFAQVDFSDGSLTRLDSAAQMTVRELDGDALAPQITVRLDIGRTWHRVQGVTGEHGAYEVETAVGTAAVRGTAFSVDCPDATACTIAVWEGVVELGEGEDVVRIEAGEVVTISPDGEQAREGGTPDELRAGDEWIDRNLVLDEDTGRFGPRREACAATLDGRNAHLADAPGRAIELDARQSADAVGLSRAPLETYDIRLSLLGQEFTAGSGTVGGGRTDFRTTVDVADYAVFGVGLYEVAAVTTGADCRLDGFVRITGRNPLTTVAGLLGALLSLLGLALLSASVRGRRSRGRRRATGAVAGVLGGLGLAVLLQQFGALPLTAGLLGSLAGGLALLGLVLARPTSVDE